MCLIKQVYSAMRAAHVAMHTFFNSSSPACRSTWLAEQQACNTLTHMLMSIAY